MAKIKHSLVIHTRFEEQVLKTPGLLALIDNDTSYSYEELNRKSNQLAYAIVELLGTKNEPVLLLIEHGAMSIVVLYAVLKAGKIVVCLDVDHPKDHNQKIASNSNAIGIITNNKNLSLGLELLQDGITLINVDELSTDLPSSNLNLPISGSDYCRITYSSGSTGEAKGIVREHRSITQSPINHTPGERISHMLSLAFSASASNIFNPLFGGGTVCCYDIKERGLVAVANWLIDDKISNFNPQLLVLRQLNRTLPTGTIFPDIQIVKLAGQVIYKHDIENFRQFLLPQAVIRHALGSTEVGLISYYDIKFDTILEDGVVPVGFPFEATEITLLGENGNQVPAGEIGAIAVSGNRIAKGYWNNEELTSQKFIPSKDDLSKRTFLSDDLGRWRPDGMLEFLGRKDFEVKVRGHRVDVSTIESAILELPEIVDVVILDYENKVDEKYLVAYIVPADESEIFPQALRKKLLERLPDYMIPPFFEVVDSIPRNLNGKIDRQGFPDHELTRPDLLEPYVTPTTSIEMKLTNIWMRALDLEKIGIDDNFFDLGGTSLQAVMLFVDVEQAFGKKLPISILMKAATVREQAKILSQDDYIANWSAIVPVRAEGSKPPLFCFSGKGGNPLRYRNLLPYLDKEQPVYFVQSRGLAGNVGPSDDIVAIATEFLHEIKKYQPAGPYQFCGDSFGGIVAYEIACQLEQQGEKIGVMAMLDSFGPGYPQFIAGTSDGKRMMIRRVQFIRKHFNSVFLSGWDSRKAYFSYYREMAGSLIKKKIEQYKLDRDNRRYITPELRKVEDANRRAVRSYQHPPFGGRVLLLRAKKQVPNIIYDYTMGWGKVDINELDIHEIDSYHGNILFEPAVGQVASVLNENLI